MNFEQMREIPHPRERNLEFARLKAVIDHVLGIPVGDPGAPIPLDARIRQLETILGIEPQRDASGNLRYLLTSGLAVELITGFQRHHHDLDLVVMDPANQRHYWEVHGTDNVTPGQYWADMSFDADFLAETSRSVRTRVTNGLEVEAVHPGVIMVQKSSDCFGRPPRAKDAEDVTAIVDHWKNRERYTKRWNFVVRTAIDALPARQQERTLERVRRILGTS